jgi:polyhydroxyalkanoate synthesis regulator phasin
MRNKLRQGIIGGAVALSLTTGFVVVNRTLAQQEPKSDCERAVAIVERRLDEWVTRGALSPELMKQLQTDLAQACREDGERPGDGEKPPIDGNRPISPAEIVRLAMPILQEKWTDGSIPTEQANVIQRLLIESAFEDRKGENVDVATLLKQAEEKMNAQLDTLVEDGALTAEQADTIRTDVAEVMKAALERAEQRDMPVQAVLAHAKRDLRMKLQERVMDETLTREQVRTMMSVLREGMPEKDPEMLEMPADPEEAIKEMRAKIERRLAQLVEEGTLTQEQADEIMTQVDEILNRVLEIIKKLPKTPTMPTSTAEPTVEMPTAEPTMEAPTSTAEPTAEPTEIVES